MAVRDVLELGTVSVGLLSVIYCHISQAHLTPGTWTAASCVLYLLLAWYLHMFPSKPASTRNYRQGNVGGVWCSLMLPISILIVNKEEPLFLLLTVAVTFCLHIYHNKDVSDLHRWMLLLVISQHISVTCVYLHVSGLIPSAGLLSTLLCAPVYLLLVSQLPVQFPQSFTLGEVAIVTQLMTQLLHRVCADGIIMGVAFLVAMTHWAADRKIGRSILLTLLAGGLTILMAVIFLIICFAVLLDLVIGKTKWGEDLDAPRWSLFAWWVLCGIASILFVCYHGYGKQIVSRTSNTTDEHTEYQSATHSQEENCDTGDFTKHNKTLKYRNAKHEPIDHSSSKGTEDQIYDPDHMDSGDKICDPDKMYLQKHSSDTEVVSKPTSVPQQYKTEIGDSDTVQRTFVSTFTRKFFHMVMLAVYIPGLQHDPLFLVLAAWAAAISMIILEVIRFYRFTFIGRLLAPYFEVFRDGQDKGELILTPLYLLLGCSVPLWLGTYIISLDRQVANISLYAGILSLGVGDTAASVVGRAIGKHHWPGSSKTVEGTLAAITSQLIVIYFLQMLHTGMHDLLSPYMMYAVILISLLEAFTSHIDNLVVSLFAYMLLTAA